MFSDWDLFMHYRGGGIGHLGTCQCNEILLADKHAPIGDTPDAGESLAELVENQGSDLESEDKNDGMSDREEDNDNELALAATTDSDIVTAVGFAAL